MGDPVAQLQCVDKVYGSGEMAVKALDGVDLTVNRGDYLAVMGASGSGKSTAMNILGCLDWLFSKSLISSHEMGLDQRQILNGLCRKHHRPRGLGHGRLAASWALSSWAEINGPWARSSSRTLRASRSA